MVFLTFDSPLPQDNQEEGARRGRRRQMGNRQPETQAQREGAWAERWGTVRRESHMCDAPGGCRGGAGRPAGATHPWPLVGLSLVSGLDAGCLRAILILPVETHPFSAELCFLSLEFVSQILCSRVYLR